MGTRGRAAWPAVVAVAALALLAACTSPSARPTSTPPPVGDAITVGSFDFAESRLLAEMYSQALESGGYQVRRAFNLGPREFVAPALARGLIDLVPEYAGTAVRFLNLGTAQPGASLAETTDALVRALSGMDVAVLASAPAQDANTFVVSRQTAERHGLRTLSDLAPVASELTFGGPPECSTRPLCLVGLDEVYRIRFKEVVSLDVGGPLTRQALRHGVVDVVLLFTTDPGIASEGFVELADDRGLQPAENVTPLVRTQAIERAGPRLVALVDAVSAHLSTDDLRRVNGLVTDGAEPGAVAASWLREEGLV